MADDITALYAELFGALRAVRAGTLDVAPARVINDLAGTIVAAARVESEYVRTMNGGGSGFLEPPPAPTALPEPGNGIVGIRRHLLRDAS